MHRIKPIIYFPLAIPAILAMLFMNAEEKRKLYMDLDRGYVIAGQMPPTTPRWLRLYRAFTAGKEFRNIVYMRLGAISHLFEWLLPGQPACGIGSTKSKNIGGGVFIQHGWSMVLDAESVGENLFINQNVTVGYRGNGHPRIGNNVRIGSGAVVLGGITIGDNVNIGANAIVVDDVPDGCTVCSPKAVIVKRR